MLETVKPLPERTGEPTMRAGELRYLVFERRDVAAQVRFMEGFGLKSLKTGDAVAYMQAQEPGEFYCYRVHRGRRDRLIGLGVEAASMDDLEGFAAAFGAPIEHVSWPAPHQKVCVKDPNGLTIEVVHRQNAAFDPVGNVVEREARTTGQELRLPLRPSRIRRLGHVVLDVHDFAASVQWYRDHLGMLATDVLCTDDGEAAVAFLRFDCGTQPRQHHSIVLGANLQVGCNHSAFQVDDLDDLAMGHQHLQRLGYRHVWGLGRHLLGSQLFDYWRDPAGEVVEHYLDSDYYDASHPTQYHRLSTGGLYQWAPRVPASFGLPPLDRHKVFELARATLEGRVSLTRLARMKWQMSERARPWL